MSESSRRARRRFAPLLCLLAALALSACKVEWGDLFDDNDDSGDDSTPPAAETSVAGLDVALSSRGFDSTYDRVIDHIADLTARSGDRIGIDHRERADDIDRRLRPTRVVLFGLARRTVPLIDADPRVALDLPPRMLVYRDADGDIGVAFDDVDYLSARYDLTDDAAHPDVDDALAALDDDLRRVAIDSTGGNAIAREGSTRGIRAGEGVVEVDSDDDLDTTLARLRDAIRDDDDLDLVATVDHQADAADDGYTIEPSVLVIFGVVETDTTLLRTRQTAGIDLPQRMLVTADDDDANARLYYNDPAYIADRHGIDGRDDETRRLSDILEDLTEAASAD